MKWRDFWFIYFLLILRPTGIFLFIESKIKNVTKDILSSKFLINIESKSTINGLSIKLESSFIFKLSVFAVLFQSTYFNGVPKI